LVVQPSVEALSVKIPSLSLAVKLNSWPPLKQQKKPSGCVDYWIILITKVLDRSSFMPTTKSAIALAENPMHHGRTKHIEIRYHFMWEKATEGLIKLAFIPTKEEAADGMTKPLAGEAFVKFIKDLGPKQV
jgi:hypothetical protein